MKDKLNELLSQSILSPLNDKGYEEFEASNDKDLELYGGWELPLKIFKFVGNIFVIYFFNFDLLLIFFLK